MNTSFIGVFIPRREPVEPPTVTFAEANVRPVEPIYYNDAPDPVRQSDFNPGPSSMPKVVFTNIPGIESVMQDEFGYPLWAPPNPGAPVYETLGPGGYPSGQLPFEDRVNIQDPQSIPFGSQLMMSSTTDEILFPVGDM